MKTLRALIVVAAAALAAGCASTPSEGEGGAASKPAASSATNISGSWALQIETPMGPRPSTLTVQQSGNTFAGTLGGEQGTREVKGTIQGDKIDFAMDVEAQGMTLNIAYTGTVTGNTMAGTVKFGDFGEGNWSGKKQ